MSFGVSHVLRSKLRFVASRAVLVLAALALLLAVVRGGTRFFYCPMTHLAFDSSPCATDEVDDDATDAPAIRVSDCCQEKWRAAAPTASTSSIADPSIAPADLVAILSHSEFELATVTATLPYTLAEAVRAGPSPPSASERRAQLMVFNN